MEIDFCPRWVLAKLGISESRQHHVALLGSTLLTLALLPLAIRIPHFCLMQKVLGIPCPGCGVCHSIMAILHVKPVMAWKANPAGVGVMSVFCFQLVQQWIDQHPAVFAAIFPIYFLCLWFLVAAIISVIGGWFSLAKVYRTRMPFNGAKWRKQWHAPRTVDEPLRASPRSGKLQKLKVLAKMDGMLKEKQDRIAGLADTAPLRDGTSTLPE